MTHRIIGKWSVREFIAVSGATGYNIFPKGERSHWSRKATLWPASDGKCFIITINDFSGRPMDARPSLDEALNFVIGILDK